MFRFVRQTIGFVPDRYGYSIAYSSIGRGRPLIYAEAGFVSHLEVLWSHAGNRRFIETLAQTHRVIRFDHRGVGLGDPRKGVESFEERIEVLEDLIAALELDQVDLFGTSTAGPAMAAYAARHPERTRRLVVFGAFADGTRLAPPEVVAAIRQLVEVAWGVAKGAMTEIWIPDGSDEDRAFMARLCASSSDASRGMALIFDESFSVNITAELPRITAPTLVIHREHDRVTRFELGRELAAAIPGARFLPLTGTGHVMFLGDIDQVITPTVEFLTEGIRAPDAPLTERELEVASLVADGLTNPEIATRLHLSPRTVGAHLEHIREKLGVRSRAQVAAWVTTRLPSR